MSQVPPPNPFQGSAYDPTMGNPTEAARGLVAAPAIALMATAGVGGALQLANLAMQLLGVGLNAAGAGGGPDQQMAILFGTVGLIAAGVGVAVAGLIIFGALKMKALENYTLPMVASVIAMIPCVSPCCLLGLPIGIWAIVVLSRPEVKGAFSS